jgi:hypothetical protein
MPKDAFDLKALKQLWTLNSLSARHQPQANLQSVALIPQGAGEVPQNNNMATP